MGHHQLSDPLRALYGAPATYLCPLPLCDGGRSRPTLRLLGDPDGTVGRPVSAGQTETTSSLPPSLVLALVTLLAGFVFAPERSSTAALLRHLPGFKLYPNIPVPVKSLDTPDTRSVLFILI